MNTVLFEVNDIDRRVYEEELADFLPEEIIDIHTHCWNDPCKIPTDGRTVTWPSKVAAVNPIEDLMETYQLLFPGKTVTPLIFPNLPDDEAQQDRWNRYVSDVSKTHHVPALIWSSPKWSAEDLSNRITAGGFLGVKSYLTMADESIPVHDVTIYDFLPPHQLEMLNEYSRIVMCHLPRPLRLRDPVNLQQLVEIDEKYPKLKFIVAHVGRAYCDSDVGDSFDILSQTKHLLFDFSANTNANVFARLLKAVSPDRILFGSDLPILRMRMKRITQDGCYINLVPPGIYGDISNDPNMREVSADDAGSLTFFMYEELLAFKDAASRVGLTKREITNIFWRNGERLISSNRTPTTDSYRT